MGFFTDELVSLAAPGTFIYGLTSFNLFGPSRIGIRPRVCVKCSIPLGLRNHGNRGSISWKPVRGNKQYRCMNKVMLLFLLFVNDLPTWITNSMLMRALVL